MYMTVILKSLRMATENRIQALFLEGRFSPYENSRSLVSTSLQDT